MTHSHRIRWTAVILSAVCALGMVVPAAAQGKETLRVAVPAASGALLRAAHDFERTHRGVSVEFVELGEGYLADDEGVARWREEELFPAPDTWDVVAGGQQELTEWGGRGLLADLRETAEADAPGTAVYENILNAVNGEKAYVFPTRVSVYLASGDTDGSLTDWLAGDGETDLCGVNVQETPGFALGLLGSAYAAAVQNEKSAAAYLDACAQFAAGGAFAAGKTAARRILPFVSLAGISQSGAVLLPALDGSDAHPFYLEEAFGVNAETENESLALEFLAFLAGRNGLNDTAYPTGKTAAARAAVMSLNVLGTSEVPDAVTAYLNGEISREDAVRLLLP